MAMIYSQIHTE